MRSFSRRFETDSKPMDPALGGGRGLQRTTIGRGVARRACVRPESIPTNLICFPLSIICTRERLLGE